MRLNPGDFLGGKKKGEGGVVGGRGIAIKVRGGGPARPVDSTFIAWRGRGKTILVTVYGTRGLRAFFSKVPSGKGKRGIRPRVAASDGSVSLSLKRHTKLHAP